MDIAEKITKYKNTLDKIEQAAIKKASAQDMLNKMFGVSSVEEGNKLVEHMQTEIAELETRADLDYAELKEYVDGLE